MTSDAPTRTPDRVHRLIDDVGRLLGDALPGEADRLGVAYSGGVDSATLAAVAVAALGADRVVAILGVSASLAARERRLAHRTAARIGIRVVEVATREQEDPNYLANGVDRCYYCKTELFTRIDDDLADELGLAAIAYGENSSDAVRPDRPGSRAATEHRVLRPLAEAGATKQDVRAMARALGVDVADKPAAPCLASRVPHGEPVTLEKLQAIDLAEDAVLAAGFSDCRVRHHGEVARIEIPGDELARMFDDTVRARVVDGVREAGFRFVTVDLAGIQSGAFTLPLLVVHA